MRDLLAALADFDAAAARLAQALPPPTPPADMWQRCVDAVALVRADFDDGSIEWQAIGRAYRALLHLEPDATWRPIVDDQTRQVVTARQAAESFAGAGPLLVAVADQEAAQRYLPAPPRPRRAA
jgi:hypothetical protein